MHTIRKFLYPILWVAILIVAVLGTGTDMTFQWPGYLLLGLVAASSVFLIRGARRTAPRFFWSCLFATVLFLAYVAARAIQSPVEYFAREDLALAGACWVVYAASALIFPRTVHRSWTVWAFLAAALLSVALCFWQFFGDQAQWILPGYSRNYLDRAGGVFNNPNHLAAFLAMLASFLGGFILFGRGSVARRLWLAFAVALLLLAMGMTKSRGGLIAVAAGASALGIMAIPLLRTFWKDRFPHVATVAAVVIAGLGSGALWLGAGQLRHRLGGQVDQEDFRPAIWASALEQNRLEPLTGTGSRTFRYYSRQFRPESLHVSVPEAEFAHNEYLQLLADYGWIGLLLGLSVVGTHLVSGTRFLRWYAKRQFPRTGEAVSDHLGLTAGALAALVAVAVHAFFDFHLHVPAVALPAAFALGILANPLGERQRRRVEKEPTLPIAFWLVRGGTVAVGAMMLWFGGRFVRSEWHYEQARVAYVRGKTDLTTFGHLYRARELDSRNPHIFLLSGHAHLKALENGMPEKILRAYAERALDHYLIASRLYPQDTETLISLGQAYDLLGEFDAAEVCYRRALKAAPLYGNVMIAYAGHLATTGLMAEAEALYTLAAKAPAYRDDQAAFEGLRQIAEFRETAYDGPKTAWETGTP